MQKFSLLIALQCIWCITTTSAAGKGRDWSVDQQIFGMKMASKALGSVCWFERYKLLGLPKIEAKNDCNFYKSYDHDSSEVHDDPQLFVREFSKLTSESIIKMNLPVDYVFKCKPLIEDYNAQPIPDESDLIDDHLENYPFKAFAYCLLDNLRQKRGSEIMEDLELELLEGRKHWMNVILDRQNEHRELHGVDPLQMAPRLNAHAQEYAEILSRECSVRPSNSSDRIHPTGGLVEGENIHAGSYHGDYGEKQFAAYRAANNWYAERENYPFGMGQAFDGSHTELLEKVKHFTQSVWKKTKFVGYGFARNLKCNDTGAPTGYLVARYYPAGNKQGKFYTNVFSTEV